MAATSSTSRERRQPSEHGFYTHADEHDAEEGEPDVTRILMQEPPRLPEHVPRSAFMEPSEGEYEEEPRPIHNRADEEHQQEGRLQRVREGHAVPHRDYLERQPHHDERERPQDAHAEQPRHPPGSRGGLVERSPEGGVAACGYASHDAHLHRVGVDDQAEAEQHADNRDGRVARLQTPSRQREEACQHDEAHEGVRRREHGERLPRQESPRLAQ